jgi:hypothetical protein
MARPSVILISIDTLRYDCVPDPPDRTYLAPLAIDPPELPGLDRLTRGAFHFTQCISAAPYTTVSHATMLTGLLPTQHGVRTFFSSSLRHDVRSLADVLRDAGYATCLMSDRADLFRAVGLFRGFDHHAENDAEVMEWWDATAGQPRLLVLHLFDVHQPYGFVRTGRFIDDNLIWLEELEQRCTARGIELPRRSPAVAEDAEELIRYARHVCLRLADRAGYAASLRLFGEGVQRFDRLRLRPLVQELERRHVFDDSVMAVTADHGEGRDLSGRHAIAHAGLLLDDVMRVPLFVRVPGIAGRRIDDQVGLIDVMPTILDLVHEPAEGNPRHWLGGRSLVPLCRRERLADRPVYGEVWHCVRARDVPFVELTESEVHGADYALRQRMLRWPHQKFTLIGQPVRFTPEWRRLPPAAFARRLYRDVLGRVEDAEGYAHVLRRLHTVRGLFRRRIFERFETCHEFDAVPKYAIYHLDRDPLEAHPQPADEDPATWHQFEQALAIMDEVNALESHAEPLLVAEQQMEAVVGRLRDLGYFE